MPWKLRGLVGLAMLLTTLPACTRALPSCRVAKPEYFRVDYRVRAEHAIDPRYDVRAADKFAALRNTWTEGTAAIRLPDRCRQTENAGKGTGMARETSEIMGTSCGFWLAEIERALVKAKYKVISWNALNQVEMTKHVPTYVAAHDLGADFVFLVNSLEDANARLGKQYEESFRFYSSNDDGANLGPHEFDTEEREKLKFFIRERSKDLRNEKKIVAFKAILDITAVDTRGGEAVWFYLKQEAKPVSNRLDEKFLFAHLPNDTQWWPVKPASLHTAPAAKDSDKAASDEDRENNISGIEDAYKAERNELVRAIVDDFMTRFSGKGP